MTPAYTIFQYTHPDQVTEKAPSGCYVSGLFLEGARWDLQGGCLAKSLPKVLIEELPILRVIPIEAHRLKLVVSLLYSTWTFYIIPYHAVVLAEYTAYSCVHHVRPSQCYGCWTCISGRSCYSWAYFTLGTSRCMSSAQYWLVTVVRIYATIIVLLFFLHTKAHSQSIITITFLTCNHMEGNWFKSSSVLKIKGLTELFQLSWR